ncbi:MAG: hypothetical protein CSYNP_04196 [Syntrophus sp. SKADARSKE-3]|nr:hypothetical protein [Syntrophus sp. SKADARSKE-3]
MKRLLPCFGMVRAFLLTAGTSSAGTTAYQLTGSLSYHSSDPGGAGLPQSTTRSTRTSSALLRLFWNTVRKIINTWAILTPPPKAPHRPAFVLSPLFIQTTLYVR